MRETTDQLENRDGTPVGLSVAPGQIIGWVNGRAVHAIAGGAPDDMDIESGDGDDVDPDADSDVSMGDDTSDDLGDDAESDADDADKDDKAPKKPAGKKDADKADDSDEESSESKLMVALRREREARRAADKQLQALRRQNETDTEKRQREAEEAAQAKYKPTAIKAAARAALLEAKVKGDPGRAVRLFNLEDLDVDDDGEVIGLEEQVEYLKREYPELFTSEDGDKPPAKKAPAKKASPKIDGAGKAPANDSPKSSAERIAALVSAGQR